MLSDDANAEQHVHAWWHGLPSPTQSWILWISV